MAAATPFTRALNFPNSGSNRIEMPDNASARFVYANAWTAVCFFRTDGSNTADASLVAKSNNTAATDQFALMLDYSVSDKLTLFNNQTSRGQCATAPAVDTWYCASVTHAASAQPVIRIYSMDGTLYSSVTCSGYADVGTLTAKTGPGCTPDNTVFPFSGDISMPAYFSRELTAAEIVRFVANPYDILQTYESDIEWFVWGKVDRSGNDIVVTEIGSGITLVDDPVLPIASKRALVFPGGGSDRLDIGDIATARFPHAGAWSTLAFVKFDNLSSDERAIVSKWSSTTNLKQFMVRSSTGSEMQIYHNAASKTSTGSLAIDTWYLVAVTHAADGDGNLYVYKLDGTAIVAGTSWSTSSDAITLTKTIEIGNTETGTSDQMDGAIQFVSYFSKELSQTEVLEYLDNPFTFANGNVATCEFFVVGDPNVTDLARDIGPDENAVTKTGTLTADYDPVRIPITDVDSNEMLRYELNEATGSSAADSAGYEQTNDPTLDSGDTPGEIGSSSANRWGADLDGICLIGDGTSTTAFMTGERCLDILTHFKTMDLTPEGTLTIIAWAFSPSPGESGTRIFGISQNGSYQTVEINMDWNAPAGPDFRLKVGSTINYFQHEVAVRSSAPPEQLAAWHDGADASDTRIYRDAVFGAQTSLTDNGDFSAWLDDTSQRIIVMNEVGGGTARCLEGNLYRTRLLDIAMTPLQLTEDFFAGPDPASEAASGPTTQAVAGTFSPDAVVIKSVSKSPGGVLSASGAVVPVKSTGQEQQAADGVLTLDAELVRLVATSRSGVVSPSSEITKKIKFIIRHPSP